MDETNDPLPHPHVSDEPHVPDVMGKHDRNEISIWFFCGILTLSYGLVLLVQGYLDLGNPPHTVLANLHPTLKWGALLTVFGLFYTVRFRPGKA